MADLSRTVAIIFNADTGPFGAAVAGLDKNISGIGAGASASSPKVAQLDKDVEALGGRKEAVNALASAFGGLVAGLGVKEFIEANVQAETFERTMTLLTGSSQEAALEFDYIKKLANTLGLELFSTADAYAQLSAATRGTALEGQGTRDIFEAVASSMSALGKSSDDAEGALLAVSQMVSKGTVSMEELRGQLGERLPGAFQVAADAMGTTTSGLVEMVSSGKLATDEFLPKFAEQLKNVYGGVQDVDTFQAAWNRLQNSLNEAFIQLGESGAMDVAQKGIEGLALSVVGSIAVFELFGKSLGNLAYTLVSLDFDGYQTRQQALVNEFGKTVENARNNFLGLDGSLRDVEKSGEAAGESVSNGMDKGRISAEDLKKTAKDADELLKKMGIDPKSFVEPLEAAAGEIQGVIKDMVNNSQINGDEMLAGLIVAIDKVSNDQLPALAVAAQGAFESGKLSAEQYDAVIYALGTKQEGLWNSMVDGSKKTNDLAESQKKLAAETKKTADEAKKYELELLKIASNEKIKVIESQFKLNIAEVEANAKVATAIIDSISQTYTADVGLIGNLMNQVKDGYSFADRTRIAIARESSARVEELHAGQMALIAAQVDYMRAKTAATSAGNPLVTIQADGLKPHLEAFMWEILGAIQVRMAYDGADMLVGKCTL